MAKGYSFHSRFLVYVCIFARVQLLCCYGEPTLNYMAHPYLTPELISDDGAWFYKEKLVVSLGYNCNNAGQLQYEGLRYTAFPFDWFFSSLKGVMSAITNDFKDFLLFENLVPDARILVSDSLYDIVIVHDFPFQREEKFLFSRVWEMYHLRTARELIRQEYDKVYAKFMRRVGRFRMLESYGGKLYFIRSLRITKSESIELLQVLRNRFKAQDVILIVVNETDEFKKPWNIPGLHNFFIPKLEKRTLERGLFTHIFQELDLL